ncbi:UNVERIFIED_CONTAM: hypothetical protein FKN15_011505 [Acipenser sinensis]
MKSLLFSALWLSLCLTAQGQKPRPCGKACLEFVNNIERRAAITSTSAALPVIAAVIFTKPVSFSGGFLMFLRSSGLNERVNGFRLRFCFDAIGSHSGAAAPSKHVEVLGLFSYDGYLHRFHIAEEIITGKQTLFVNYIMLFKESLLYKISFHNKTCERLPLSVPFRPLEVPQDASFGGQLIIGGSSKPGEGLLVNLWKGTDPQTKALRNFHAESSLLKRSPQHCAVAPSSAAV